MTVSSNLKILHNIIYIYVLIIGYKYYNNIIYNVISVKHNYCGCIIILMMFVEGEPTTDSKIPSIT